MILHALIVQLEITELNPSHFLIFIENEVTNHFYFVHAFDGKVNVIKAGSEESMTAQFEQLESKLKKDGWRDLNGVIEDRFKFETDGSREIGDQMKAEMFFGKAIYSKGHVQSLMSTLRGSHTKQLEKMGLSIKEKYPTWGAWS